MALKVKLDEDLSPRVADAFRAAGYEVATVVEQSWGGLTDHELWLRVASEGLYFVTADRGFGDIRAYPPGTHPGILVLRPDRQSILDFRNLVASVVERHNLGDLARTVAVATPRGVRVRRNPSREGKS